MKDGESVFLEDVLSDFAVVMFGEYISLKFTYFFKSRNYRNVPEIGSFSIKLTLVK